MPGKNLSSGRGIRGISSTRLTNSPAFMVGAGGGYLGSSGYRGTDRSIQINASTYNPRKFYVFYINQLNNVGSSMFAPNADGVRRTPPALYSGR